jgi:RNA polymerase-binding transcription factor DksA
MDDIDLANQHEDRYTKTLIELHERRAKARPEYDSTGAKTCTECGEAIAPLRAALDWVATCLLCQQEIERA